MTSHLYIRLFMLIYVPNMCESIPAASIPPGQTPGAFEKIGQIPGSAGNFCWQMPRPPRSFYDGQMPGPTIHPTHLQKY